MKRLITLLLLVLLIAVAPASVSAQQYGQGSVLGEEDEEIVIERPLPEAGLAENVAAASGVLLLAAGYFYTKSKSKNSVSFK